MSASYRFSKGPSQQAGLAVVELALVTTFMVFLLMVSGEFGRLYYQYNQLTKSVRPAARFLADNTIDSVGNYALSDDDKNIAKNLILYGSPKNTGNEQFASLSSNDIDIVLSDGHVSVDVAWNYQPVFGLIPSIKSNDDDIDTSIFLLRASLTMRALQ